ncbi:MAG TPA: hypothetical protein IAB71_06760 [Candidatus Scatomonas pullistercoris]|uniref:Uncharacterized protein n=1 Tax=Candidatus Scatomonas pullistercoris TaxID=2840920 RepID=A0A9D1P2S0_9FIRM|nr:hypothetical protein [Candidatus Scatomonas pullistercoris]
MLNEGEVRVLRKSYEKYADKLYCYLLALGGKDTVLAEDLCQEVWVHYAGRIRDMKGWKDNQVLAWLRLTARIKYRRHTQKGSVVSECPVEAFQEDLAEESSAEDVVMANLLFRETFQKLEPTERELVRCKIEGISYREGHPEDTRSANALAIRCSRAFRKWRRVLAEEGLEYI